MALKRNVIANFAGQGWTAVMGLAFIPLYIHYLGVEAFGLIGLYAVLQAWLALLDMGMSPTLNREMARFTAGTHSAQSIRDLLRSLEVIALCIAATIAFSVWTVSGFLATDWLQAEKLPVAVVAQAISIMGMIIALRLIESIYRGSLFGLQRQVWYNAVNAVLATLRHGGVVIVLAWISPDIQAFFYWQAAISLLAVAILAVGVHRALPVPPAPPRFSPGAIAEIWRFAGGTMAVTFLAILLTQLDKMLLARLLPLETFAYYMLAATVAGALYLAIGPITSAFFPRMVEFFTREDRAGLSETYHLGAQLVTLVTAPTVMLLCFFPGDIIYVWSGSVELAGNVAPILSVLALGVFLNGLMQMPAQLQLAYGWVRLCINTNLVAVVVLVPAIFWAVPRYGAMGAAWIWVTLNAGYILVNVQLMHRRLLAKEKWKWYFADVLVPLAGSAVVMLLIGLFRPESYQDRLQGLIFLLIAGMLAFAATALLADRVRPRLWARVRSRAV